MNEKKKKKRKKKKTRAHFRIQCARRLFHSYLKETKRINNQFLNEWKKTTSTLYGGRSPPYENVHVGFFIHTSRKLLLWRCLQWRNARLYSVLFDAAPCYWKSLCKIPRAQNSWRYESIVLTNRIAGKRMNIKKIKLFKDDKRIKTTMSEEKRKQFEEPVFGHVGFFQRWKLGVE